MTEEKRLQLIFDHRLQLVCVLKHLGYCCKLNPMNMSISFYGKAPSQEIFDRANYTAFLMVQSDEREKGNTVELLDLIY